MVRVRIAPSPTGELHVGNARSALFNWLFTRSQDGTLVLRLDDTDLARSEPRFAEDITTGLRWLGLDWDEGFDLGGPHGTYRQSERLERYQAAAQQLLEAGHAYYDDRDPDTLEQLRQRARTEGKHPGTYIRRLDPPATSGVIRFSANLTESVSFPDLVRGELSFEGPNLDDFVILRSDQTPTYHLASVVDDIDYQITHVIRGEDLLPSTPKHILLTRALGEQVPQYAHLPLLFGPDSKKLSKRHGDVSLAAFRQVGYLPEAMFNYLCLLGWSLDAETTIFSRSAALESFRLEDVSRNPAIFDREKLEWMSGEYFRTQITPARFRELALTEVETQLDRALTETEQRQLEELSPVLVERIKKLSELMVLVGFLFGELPEYDPSSWKKVMKPEAAGALTVAEVRLQELKEWDPGSLEESLRRMLEENSWSARKGWQPIRVAVTGSTISPPLFESLAALGKEVTLHRLRHAQTLMTD